MGEEEHKVGRSGASEMSHLVQKTKILPDIKKDDVVVEKEEIVRYKPVSEVRLIGDKPGRSLARKSFPKWVNFANELLVAQTADHPCIVKYVGVDNDSSMLFMEKLYSNLFHYLVDKCRDKDRLNLQSESGFRHFLIPILQQIAEGMRYLHDQGFVHGDLKPENILVSSNVVCPRVKICDFGSAQSVVGYICQGVGPPMNEAPEVRTWRKGRKGGVKHGVDSQVFEDPQKIDVFSFGTTVFLILYWLTTGDFKPAERWDWANFHRLEEEFGSCDKGLALLSLVNDCRNSQAKERPPFPAICEKLKELANVEFDGGTLSVLKLNCKIQSMARLG